MKFHKFFQYLYLVAAILFFVDAIMKFQNNETSWWIFSLYGCAALFMFFFKRKFVKEYEEKNKVK